MLVQTFLNYKHLLMYFANNVMYRNRGRIYSEERMWIRSNFATSSHLTVPFPEGSWDEFPVPHAPFYWQRGKRPQLKITSRHQEKMLLCLLHPCTKQMPPHSQYSACWRTGSPAASNKDLQVRVLKTKQLQTCSLTAWRKVCSEDVILQCLDCPQLLCMFLCLQRGCQWCYWIWVWQCQLMLKMTQATAGQAGHLSFLLPQPLSLCIYVASLNVSPEPFRLWCWGLTQPETLISVLQSERTQYQQGWKACPVQPGCTQLSVWTWCYPAEQGVTIEYTVLSAAGRK